MRNYTHKGTVTVNYNTFISKAKYKTENFTYSIRVRYMYTEKYKEKPYNGLNFSQSL